MSTPSNDFPPQQVIATLDQTYPIAPRTVANKRAYNEVLMRSRIVGDSERTVIAESMGMSVPDADLTEGETYIEMGKVLFPSAPISEHPDDVDQEIVSEAMRFFRRRSLGMQS